MSIKNDIYDAFYKGQENRQKGQPTMRRKPLLLVGLLPFVGLLLGCGSDPTPTTTPTATATTAPTAPTATPVKDKAGGQWQGLLFGRIQDNPPLVVTEPVKLRFRAFPRGNSGPITNVQVTVSWDQNINGKLVRRPGDWIPACSATTPIKSAAGIDSDTYECIWNPSQEVEPIPRNWPLYISFDVTSKNGEIAISPDGSPLISLGSGP